MPNITKPEIKHATIFELNTYCKTLRRHFEKCVEMNKAGYRAANDKLPHITELCQYAGKYAQRALDPASLLKKDMVDLNQFQLSTLQPLRELHKLLKAVEMEVKVFNDAYIHMTSTYYKKRIRQHCEMTLQRLQFGDPEIIGTIFLLTLCRQLCTCKEADILGGRGGEADHLCAQEHHRYPICGYQRLRGPHAAAEYPKAVRPMLHTRTGFCRELFWQRQF